MAGLIFSMGIWPGLKKELKREIEKISLEVSGVFRHVKIEFIDIIKNSKDKIIGEFIDSIKTSLTQEAGEWSKIRNTLTQTPTPTPTPPSAPVPGTPTTTPPGPTRPAITGNGEIFQFLFYYATLAETDQNTKREMYTFVLDSLENDLKKIIPPNTPDTVYLKNLMDVKTQINKITGGASGGTSDECDQKAKEEQITSFSENIQDLNEFVKKEMSKVVGLDTDQKKILESNIINVINESAGTATPDVNLINKIQDLINAFIDENSKDPCDKSDTSDTEGNKESTTVNTEQKTVGTNNKLSKQEEKPSKQEEKPFTNITGGQTPSIATPLSEDSKRQLKEFSNKLSEKISEVIFGISPENFIDKMMKKFEPDGPIFQNVVQKAIAPVSKKIRQTVMKVLLPDGKLPIGLQNATNVNNANSISGGNPQHIVIDGIQNIVNKNDMDNISNSVGDKISSIGNIVKIFKNSLTNMMAEMFKSGTDKIVQTIEKYVNAEEIDKILQNIEFNEQQWKEIEKTLKTMVSEIKTNIEKNKPQLKAGKTHKKRPRRKRGQKRQRTYRKKPFTGKPITRTDKRVNTTGNEPTYPTSIANLHPHPPPPPTVNPNPKTPPLPIPIRSLHPDTRAKNKRIDIETPIQEHSYPDDSLYTELEPEQKKVSRAPYETNPPTPPRPTGTKNL
jgi:hypothetical protein